MNGGSDINLKKFRFQPRLEALRGLAAVSVIGFHAVNDEVVTGMAPVVLFFVLSGFVLARSLENEPSALLFFHNRILRLLPAAAGSVLLISALYWLFGFYVGYLPSFSPQNVLLNAMMLRSDINGPMWSLTVECFAAPLIFASFFGCRAFGIWPIIVLCAALFFLSFQGDYVHLLGGFTNLAPLYAFVVGVSLHFAVIKKVKLPVSPETIALGAFALLLTCALRKQTSLTILGEVIASGAIIFLVATRDQAAIFAVLDCVPARFIGRISYSLYLMHMIGLGVAARWQIDSAIWIFLCAIIITTPLAWLSWRFIEVPFQRLKLHRQDDGSIAPQMIRMM